jgi:hypothetical protein
MQILQIRELDPETAKVAHKVRAVNARLGQLVWAEQGGLQIATSAGFQPSDYEYFVHYIGWKPVYNEWVNRFQIYEVRCLT